MEPSFQTVFTIVATIEGFSIWKGRKFLMPQVECLEDPRKLTKEDFANFARTLQSGDSQRAAVKAAFGVLKKWLYNWVATAIVRAINFIRIAMRWILLAMWYVADAIVRLSAVVTIPALAILYLHDNECCTETSFKFANWVLWFVYIKTGCYILLLSISGLAYLKTHVRLKHNKSILPSASGACSISCATHHPPPPPPPPKQGNP